MSEHTPGPWRILEWANERKGFIAIVGPSDPPEHVSDVFPFGKRAEGQPLAQHQANARLIAAAPELLNALQELLHDAFEDAHPEGVKKARAAIAKAEGAALASSERDQ